MDWRAGIDSWGIILSGFLCPGRVSSAYNIISRPHIRRSPPTPAAPREKCAKFGTFLLREAGPVTNSLAARGKHSGDGAVAEQRVQPIAHLLPLTPSGGPTNKTRGLPR